MEELSELCLNIGDTVNSFDDLYTCMDGDSFDTESRPPSLMSWAFSPIADTDNNSQDFSFVLPEQSACDTTNQTDIETHDQPITDLQKTEPSNQEPECHTENHQQQISYNPLSNQSTKQVTAQMNNYSEYNYPNNITYHHSVNIHNYVGNYCPPVWWGNQPCNILHSGYDNKVPGPYVQLIEQTCDPLVGVASSPSAEFTRCSTPDYLLALNALKQLDSPPRPNHSAAMTFPPCSSFEEKSVSERNSPQQDSGYNSDLNVSPVIQYQDQVKLRRHTSTPNSISNTYPVLHRANIHPSPRVVTPQYLPMLNHANIHPTPRSATPQYPPLLHHTKIKPTQRLATPQYPPQFIQPTFTSSMPLCPDNVKKEPVKEQILPFQPTVPMCPENMKPEAIKEHIYKALQNKITVKSAVHSNMPQTISEQLQSSNEKLLSVADYQAQKKIAADKKQKLKTEHTTSTKRKAEIDSDISSKKRRHNEPLNQKALDVMNNWYESNNENPYPNKAEKELIAKEGGISLSQVKSWFANKRNRSNNTRPKKQKKEMEGRLLEICHQLARDAAKPNKDNAYYIQQLSSIMH